jgi:peptidyl-prolyl cis-trans isomerase C
MLKTSRLAALALFGVMAAGTVYAADDKPAVKGTPITISQDLIDQRVKMITAQQGQADSPELRKSVRDDLINVQLIAEQAHKKGLDAQPEFVQQAEIAKQNLLANAFVQDFVKSHPVTDDDISKEYEVLKKNTLGSKEYNVRHILVEKESDAKAIEAKLKKDSKDSNFEKLAKASSKDGGSKEHGGDLGWNIPTNFVKPFADALQTLTKGQISEPVQSQFGWHIIKLEDVRDVKVPSLDEIKPRIAQHLQQLALKKYIDELRENAKIDGRITD